MSLSDDITANPKNRKTLTMAAFKHLRATLRGIKPTRGYRPETMAAFEIAAGELDKMIADGVGVKK